jgi:epoxide hydrolase-like predicted phosphatase
MQIPNESKAIKAVIFDAGGVLHESNSAVQGDLLNTLNLNEDTLRSIWENQIPLLGSGQIDEANFWQQLSKEYGIRPVSSEENLLGRSFKDTLKPHIEVTGLVRELGSRGLKLAVLSNTIEPHARALREVGQYEGFDRLFLSHEVGLRKPDPAIYEYALSELAVQPNETVFIDDDKTYLEAARALGINGIVFSSAVQLVGELGQYIPNLEFPKSTY